MLEWLLYIADKVPADSLEEILGLLIIIYLLLILKRIKERRIKNETGIVHKDQPTAVKAPDRVEPPPQPLETKDITPAPPADQPPETVMEAVEEPTGFFNRLKAGLSKTRQTLSKQFDTILSGKQDIDDDTLEEIEEALITSDVGVSTTTELISRISKKISTISDAEAFKRSLKEEMLSFIDFDHEEQRVPAKPYVIMVIGVNGVGKTTTIGKMAAMYASEGKKVLLSASDTFRAAAVEQLEVWARRAKAKIVKHRDKADPAAVAFDSVEAAVARGFDVVIVDTAGRLHTKVNLMEQLKKIKRSIAKKLPDAPHEVLLVLDATTGQNAVSQARLFHDEIGITGIVLTKLDGTAKGGIVLAICHALNTPIRYIGIGEGIEDLQHFNPQLFIDALL